MATGKLKGVHLSCVKKNQMAAAMLNGTGGVRRKICQLIKHLIQQLYWAGNSEISWPLPDKRGNLKQDTTL